MFIPTSGYIKYRQTTKDIDMLMFKTTDQQREIEVFHLGYLNRYKERRPNEVYCIKKGDEIIPFHITRSEKVDSIPLKNFVVKSTFPIYGDPCFDVIDVTVSRLGEDLKNMKIRLANLSYLNIWLDRDIRGHTFINDAEMEETFKIIQESIPQLLFEDYLISYKPRPVVVRHVIPAKNLQIKSNDSGSIEKKCLKQLMPKDLIPESPQSVIDVLELLSDQSPLKIENIMSELHRVERMALYYNNSYLSTCIQDSRLFNILRKSYESYYKNMYKSFESFLVLIIILLNSRSCSRDIHMHTP